MWRRIAIPSKLGYYWYPQPAGIIQGRCGEDDVAQEGESLLAPAKEIVTINEMEDRCRNEICH
jgi:hypothetical protein